MQNYRLLSTIKVTLLFSRGEILELIIRHKKISFMKYKSSNIR